MTMSDFASAPARSSQSCTSAPKRAASSSARARVRFVTVSVAPRERSARAARSDILPAPTTSTLLAVEVAEEVVRDLDGHGADRDGVARDLGLAAHAARGARGALRAAVEHGPGRARARGRVEHRLHLAEDLRLAHDERVEARGDAEEVLDALALEARVEVRLDLRLEHAGAAREVDAHGAQRGVGVRGHGVDLDAVAGVEQRDLAHAGQRLELEQRRVHLLGRHGELLAQRDGRRAVRDTEDDDVDGGRRPSPHPTPRASGSRRPAPAPSPRSRPA